MNHALLGADIEQATAFPAARAISAAGKRTAEESME